MEHPTAPAANIARIEELARRGQLAEAEVACLDILRQQPGLALAWAWLGTLRLALQRFAEAEAALRQAIALDGRDAHYWTNAAIALRAQRKAADAEAFARQAVGLDPSQSTHWAGLAGSLADQRRLDEAAAAYREAVARPGTDAGTWAEFATVEHLLGHFAEAHQAFERSLALDSSNLEVQTKYAMLLIDAGQPQDAVTILQHVVSQKPGLALAWVALGRAYRLLDDLLQAESAFRHALQLVPNSREARHDLALILLSRWEHPEAEAIVRGMLADEPAFAEAWLLLGVILHVQARIDEALPALRRAVELSPTPVTVGKLLVSLHYADGVTAEKLLAEHEAWDKAFAHQFLPPAPPGLVARRPEDPLRLGLVAGDFSAGPTGYLALPAVESLDKSACSVTCYSDRLREDEYTARFRAAADRWRTTIGVSDEELAKQVRADEIDILIDLSGHVGARLLMFARKPAALQVTWLGYVGTTGMAAMDCLLADRFHVREGEDAWYCERVLRMPHGYACYGPPPVTPEVGPLPARQNGFVTFGCFNNPVKFTPRLLDLWGEVLRRVPSARLLLKYFGLQQPHLQGWLRDQFLRRGVSPERLLLEGWSPHGELLAAYNRVDIALDTQPYSGGLTTCEALWMGVPVVTFPGRTFAGRHSTSHLTNAGYSQFVAEGAGEYVELAVRWAEQLDELATLRAGLRQQMQRSPLCDASRFAADWLALLCTAWQTQSNRASAGR